MGYAEYFGVGILFACISLIYNELYKNTWNTSVEPVQVDIAQMFIQDNAYWFKPLSVIVDIVAWPIMLCVMVFCHLLFKV